MHCSEFCHFLQAFSPRGQMVVQSRPRSNGGSPLKTSRPLYKSVCHTGGCVTTCYSDSVGRIPAQTPLASRAQLRKAPTRAARLSRVAWTQWTLRQPPNQRVGGACVARCSRIEGLLGMASDQDARLSGVFNLLYMVATQIASPVSLPKWAMYMGVWPSLRLVNQDDQGHSFACNEIASCVSQLTPSFVRVTVCAASCIACRFINESFGFELQQRERCGHRHCRFARADFVDQ